MKIYTLYYGNEKIAITNIKDYLYIYILSRRLNIDNISIIKEKIPKSEYINNPLILILCEGIVMTYDDKYHLYLAYCNYAKRDLSPSNKGLKKFIKKIINTGYMEDIKNINNHMEEIYNDS